MKFDMSKSDDKMHFIYSLPAWCITFKYLDIWYADFRLCSFPRSYNGGSVMRDRKPRGACLHRPGTTTASCSSFKKVGGTPQTMGKPDPVMIWEDWREPGLNTWGDWDNSEEPAGPWPASPKEKNIFQEKLSQVRTEHFQFGKDLLSRPWKVHIIWKLLSPVLQALPVIPKGIGGRTTSPESRAVQAASLEP